MNKHPIAIFDSGYGGLTVLKSIAAALPQYDYIYMGDNARAPYGTRSFDQVYKYTHQAVEWFFAQGCELVVLACNTASAKALRSIQQNDLEKMGPEKRVLGVIRPTAEVIGHYSITGHVGVLGTTGTVQSGSYPLEIKKFFPEIQVTQEACPMWVPLIENNEYESDGADYFVAQHIKRLLKNQTDTDCILLACTHYPLLMNKIQQFVPSHIRVIEQGAIVANSLADYLQRHPEMEQRCSKNGQIRFYTTGDPADFDEHGSRFFGKPVQSIACQLV